MGYRSYQRPPGAGSLYGEDIVIEYNHNGLWQATLTRGGDGTASCEQTWPSWTRAGAIRAGRRLRDRLNREHDKRVARREVVR